MSHKYKENELPWSWKSSPDQACSASTPGVNGKRIASSVFLRFVTLLLGCMVATVGGAQTPQQPVRLTLKEAVNLALKQSTDVQIANLDMALRQQDRRVAEAALLPQASLQASEEISRYNLEALIGLQFAGVPKNVGPFQSIRVGPRFSTPVFDLELIRRYRASGDRAAASKEDARSTREQTVLLTVSQYFAELRAIADFTAATSRVQLATSLEEQAKALEAGGVATQIDIARASVSVAEQKQRLADAQSAVETASFALRRILNLPSGEAIELVDRDALAKTPDLDIPNAVSLAFAQRPELASLAATVKASSEDRQAALARSLPTLNANGGWNEQGRTLGNIFPGYDYTISFNVPIFTGGRLAAERKSALFEERRTLQQQRDAQNRVAEQVQADEVELRVARSDVDLGRERVRLANQEITLAQGRFAAGVTDNIEVTTAQDELARANDAEISSLYRFNIAKANLARAVGSMEALYTQP